MKKEYSGIQRKESGSAEIRREYRSNIAEYVKELDVDASTKRKIYIALNGGIYNSLDKGYRENAGTLKGSKTMYFEDGTKQRIDTYEGRIKAVSRLLGEDGEKIKDLYGILSKNQNKKNYLINSLQEKLVKGYEQVSKNEDLNQEKKSLEKKLEGYDATSMVSEKEHIEKSEGIHNKDKQKGVFKKIAIGAASLLVGATLLGKSVYNKIQNSYNNKKDYSTNQIVQIDTQKDNGNKPYSVVERTYSEKNFPETKKNISKANGLEEKLFEEVASESDSINQFLDQAIEKGINDTERIVNDLKDYVASEQYEEVQRITSELKELEKEYLKIQAEESESSVLNNSNLEKVLKENPIQSTEESVGKNYDYSSQRIDNSFEKQIVVPEKQIEQKEKYSIGKDLKKYIEHTSKRNSQIQNNSITINPSPFFVQTANNFSDMKEELTNYDSIGYSEKNISERNNGIKTGLKKIGNGLQKLVSLGFWDSREKEEKEKEGNQVLRVLKSPYDVVIGAGKTAIHSADHVVGGILEKTVDSAVAGVRGVVGSAVSATNYVGAIPFYALNGIEKQIHDGNISQKTYEGIFSLARFGGNVISHEVPEKGKFIEVIANDGNKTIIDKGEIGATLELAFALGLDSVALKKITEGSGNSSGNGNWVVPDKNGGVDISPGGGGPVGGGL